MPDAVGHRFLHLLGEPACVRLLAVLELPEVDRAAAIGALYRPKPSVRGR